MGKKLFDKLQEDYIIQNYKTMSDQELGKILGVKASQIHGWLNYRKMSRTNKVKFSQSDKDYIISHYKVDSYKDIASVLGCTAAQIKGWVNNHIGGKVKIRNFNDDYFENIDCLEKAYWLGFLYADGWVIYNKSKRNYECSIQLQANDLDSLQDLNNELGGVHQISFRHKETVILNNPEISKTDSYILRIFSKKLVEDLMSHNILPNKTQFPIYPIVDQNLFLDFIRGYIDGDGCIYYYNKKRMLYVHITGAHKDVFTYIQKVLIEQYEINSSIYSESERKYRIILTGKNALRLLDLIYENPKAPKLKRKYEKYVTIKAAISNIEMKKSGKIGEAPLELGNTEVNDKIA